jgi:hypothetical protein
MIRVAVAAAGIVIGFLLMTSPAQADTGGLSASLKKTTHATVGAVGKHATKTVRHAAKVSHARPVSHKISKPATHRVVARKFAPVHRAAVTAPAHRVAVVRTHTRHVAGKAAAKATKITPGAAKPAMVTAKIATAAGKAAAPATGALETGTTATRGLLKPVADAGAVLSEAIPPAAQPVLMPTYQLRDRALATLQDKIAQGIPPVVDIPGLGPITDPLNPIGNSIDIVPPITADTGQLATGSAAARAHQGVVISGADSATSGGLNTALSDLAGGVSQILSGTRASAEGAAAAVALLTIAVGFGMAGSASSGGPGGVSFAFVDGNLLTSAAGRARRLGDILRQTGWRTAHRPSFSPD